MLLVLLWIVKQCTFQIYIWKWIRSARASSSLFDSRFCQASNATNWNTPFKNLVFPASHHKKYQYSCSRSPCEPVTSALPLGFCPDSRPAALFSGLMIPFKLHSNLPPVLFPSRLPGGHQTIHLEDFMSPCSAIKASVKMWVLKAWIGLCSAEKVRRFCIGLCGNVHVGWLKQEIHTRSQKKGR